MNIEKTQSGINIKIENSVNIFLDPVKISDGDVNIITDPQKSINHSKIFNLPGDYELNGVLIKGFDGEKYAFLIKDDVSVLCVAAALPQNTIDEIRENYGEIDCIISPEISKPEILIEQFGIKIFITFNKPVKINDYSFEKTRFVKINPKKLSRASYFLE